VVVVDGEFAIPSQKPQNTQLIVTTPNTLKRKLNLLGIEEKAPKVIHMRAMTRDETKKFVENIENKGSLTTKELINFSLGVPLLVNRLSQLYITQEEAILIVASYLISQFGKKDVINEDYLQYFNMKPPKEILEAIKNFNSTNPSFKERLNNILTRYEMDSNENPGKTLMLPHFVDTETAKIINEAAKKSDQDHCVDYVAELSEQQLQKLIEEFGINERLQTVDLRNARRFIVFDASGRKTTIIIEILGIRLEDQRGFANKAEKATQLLEQYLVSNEEESTYRLIIHKAEHSELGLDVAKFAEAFETFFQQAGVEYVVQNVTAKLIYRYDPDKERIEIVEELPD